MVRCGGARFAKQNSVMKTLFLLVVFLLFFSNAALAQNVTRDQYWGGGSKIQKDSLGQTSDITGMEVTADDEKITVTISGPFFYNYAHHIKGAHKTPPGDLYISSAGWRVKGKAPYTQDTFTKDEGWDYVVSLFDKSVYKLDWSKIQWSRPKPGSVIYRRDQAWRGGYGDFVSWADIQLTEKALVISFPRDALFPEAIPSSTDVAEGDEEDDGGGTGEDTESAGSVEIGLHWTMMCANDVIEGAFSLPATIYSDYEEAEEIPLPRPTTWAPPPTTPLVPWSRTFKDGTIVVWWPDGDSHDHYNPPTPRVPEPSTALLLLGGLSAVGFLVYKRRKP